MADKSGVDTKAAEQGLLEGEDHSRFRHEFRELGDSTGAPRPYLRRDIVEHRHSRSLRRGSQLHVEAGIVYKNHERNFTPLEHLPDPEQQQIMRGDVLQNFQKPHHSQLAVAVNQLDALLRQSGTAHGYEGELGPQVPQR